MQHPIAFALKSIALGTPVSHRNLTMIPLVGSLSVEQEPDYLTLDQALAQALAEVTEISEQGSVPQLRVANKGAKPIFILDGEELIGVKQNRVVNLSILVPAQTTLTIPVSCVEAGRWRTRSRTFSSAPRTQYAAGRAARMAQVTVSMRRNASYAADQADVWAGIAAKSERLGVSSPTSAMEEIFVQHAESIEEYVSALAPAVGQVGALFLIDRHVVGFDLFDRASTLRRLLPKLLRSVAIDALESLGDVRRSLKPSLALTIAEHFLRKVVETDVHLADAVGLGRDVRLVGEKVCGSALVHDQEVVHAAAFGLQ
jgi:hypothetical protein